MGDLRTLCGEDFAGGWPLEYFAAELFLKCYEGSPFESMTDERIRNLFYRRSGPIAAAIAIVVEQP